MQTRGLIRRVLAIALIVAGLALAASPFVGTWRLGGEVLDQLPESPSAADTRPALALFDDEFVLASRTYVDTTPAEVDASLRAAGFDEQYRRGGESWLWRTCCGEYDAALARVDEGADGQVEVALTVFDDDVQFAWWMLSLAGLVLVAIGLFLVLSGRQPPAAKTATDRPREKASV